jgi:hypothetical protein
MLRDPKKPRPDGACEVCRVGRCDILVQNTSYNYLIVFQSKGKKKTTFFTKQCGPIIVNLKEIVLFIRVICLCFYVSAHHEVTHLY